MAFKELAKILLTQSVEDIEIAKEKGDFIEVEPLSLIKIIEGKSEEIVQNS